MSSARPRPTESQSPVPRLSAVPSETRPLELEDHSEKRFPADLLFPVGDRRAAAAHHGRLLEQFLRSNRRLFDVLQLRVATDFDGNRVYVVVESESMVGAVPLVSPLTGKMDFGLIIQPRFPWQGLGPMLGQMGWRVAPRPLRLPLLRRSERRVPPWVISLMVLERLEVLVREMERRFELTESLLSTPKGTIRWQSYLSHQVPTGKLQYLPCRFPDLRDDRILKGMVRWAVEAQVSSLRSQLAHGAFVHQLLERAHKILLHVHDETPVRPTARVLQMVGRLPLRSEIFHHGLEAIEWTAEERGLAGLCELEGIPWVMDMDLFFEAWVECVLERASREIGGLLRRGRTRQTQAPLRWEPPSAGTQVSLIPDLVLEAPDFTLIADAKYKRHLEEYVSSSHHVVSEETRERHRADVLQVLAYSTLFSAKTNIALLAYPCRRDTWESLRQRHLCIQRAVVPAQRRSCELWLAALPMQSRVEEAAEPVVQAIRELRLRAA